MFQQDAGYKEKIIAGLKQKVRNTLFNVNIMNVMLPPPCFTVRLVFSRVMSGVGFWQILAGTVRHLEL